MLRQRNWETQGRESPAMCEFSIVQDWRLQRMTAKRAAAAATEDLVGRRLWAGRAGAMCHKPVDASGRIMTARSPL